MSALRDEIIEAEKARSDFLKWKLIIVSGLGGAGLGFTGKTVCRALSTCFSSFRLLACTWT